MSGFTLADRVIDINPLVVGTSFTVAIDGVTIQAGAADDGFGGGGIWSGNGAKLTLTNSVVENNATSDAKGGGIVSTEAGSQLLLINTTVQGNVVQPASIGVDGSGGGIYARQCRDTPQ